MNDWNIIWNAFCDEVSASVKKNKLEKIFEEDIAREFFRALDWYRFNNGLKEQYPIKVATATLRADFALFVADKETPEVIVELKRPKKKREEKDAKQLIDYMKQVSCSYGILLLGDKLEIYYIDYSKPKHEASLVETIKYQHNNEAARHFMEVLNRSTYDTAHLLEYCHKRVKINKSVEYWCSEDGKTEIMNMIVERSKLPDHLLETLRTTLIIDVKRIDGLTPVSTSKRMDILIPASTGKKDVTTKIHARSQRVWMIRASSKFFRHKDCFDELGFIYWKQSNNLQVGDTGYIYFTAPQSKIVHKFEIDACNLPYSKEMDVMLKYYNNPKDFETAKEHNRFCRIRPVGESKSGKLTTNNMMKNGLTGTPQGAMILSKESSAELLAFIEANF